MRKASFAIAAVIVALLAPSRNWSQQTQQPILYYGYAGIDNDSDASRVNL